MGEVVVRARKGQKQVLFFFFGPITCQKGGGSAGFRFRTAAGAFGVCLGCVQHSSWQRLMPRCSQTPVDKQGAPRNPF